MPGVHDPFVSRVIPSHTLEAWGSFLLLSVETFMLRRRGYMSRVIEIGTFMSLLLVLSAPSLSAIVCMVAGTTVETLYPRLQSSHKLVRARVLRFPQQS